MCDHYTDRYNESYIFVSVKKLKLYEYCNKSTGGHCFVLRALALVCITIVLYIYIHIYIIMLTTGSREVFSDRTRRGARHSFLFLDKGDKGDDA